MATTTSRILPPTFDEIESSRKYLREELAKSEGQPEETMRSAEEVFAEKRKRTFLGFN